MDLEFFALWAGITMFILGVCVVSISRPEMPLPPHPELFMYDRPDHEKPKIAPPPNKVLDEDSVESGRGWWSV